jgi:hypothetical protein
VRLYLKKNPITKNWAGGVAQGVGPEFKPQYCKKKKKKERKKLHKFFEKLLCSRHLLGM